MQQPTSPYVFLSYASLDRERALNRHLTRRAKLGREQPKAGLVGTAIRAFAEWWYEHPEVPRALVVDAIMDVAVAAARHLPRG